MREAVVAEQPSSLPHAASLTRVWSSELTRLAVSVLFALLAILLRLPDLHRYATIDESRWVGRSADFVTYIQEQDWDKTFIVGHPGVTTMWLGALGMGPRLVDEFSYLEGQTDVTRRDGYLEALVAARRGPLVANGLLLGLLVWLAWGVFGPGPALLGGLLLVADPFLGAHSRFIHLDGLLAGFMTVAALSGIALWSGRSWGYLVLAGLASGLAFLTKAPSIFLLAFVPALATFQHVRTGGWVRPTGWLRFLGGLAGWLGLALGVGLALWPVFRLSPLTVPRQLVEFAAKNGGSERDNFFLGQPVEDPGALFYPLALLFRATPLLLLGLALLGYALVRWRSRLPGFWPALLLAGYAVGTVLMMSLGQKKFDRYILPAFPALDLLAGLGLWTAWRIGLPGALRSALRGPRSVAVGAIILLLAAWPLASVYPYHLAYYNPLLGGGAAAQRLIFVGWGEGLDQVAAYLNTRPLVLQAPTVATAYHRALQAHLNGNNAMPLERAALADYIVPYVNSIQRNQNAADLAPFLTGQEPEHVIWINGIEYARIYRGPHLAVDRPVDVEFAGRLRLESLAFAPGSGVARAGEDLLLRLRYRPLGDASALIAVVQLLGQDARPLVQERLPLARAIEEDGLLLVDLQLRLPAALQPGDYRILALVDDPAAGLLPPSGGEAGVPIQTVSVRPATQR